VGVFRWRRIVLRCREAPIRFSWVASPEKGGTGVGNTRSEAGSSSLERAAYTIPEFCFRNNISRPTYHRLRAEGRGPVEMRLGLNAIRITAEAERDWQRRMQEPRADLETRTVARAVKAGDAAVKSNRHISKKRAARRER
jgi:hypothetical protein